MMMPRQLVALLLLSLSSAAAVASASAEMTKRTSQTTAITGEQQQRRIRHTEEVGRYKARALRPDIGDGPAKAGPAAKDKNKKDNEDNEEVVITKFSNAASPSPPKPAPAPTPLVEEARMDAQFCPNSLKNSISIDSSATLYYAIVPSHPSGSTNGLLCARLEVSTEDGNEEGWVGLGISTNGGMRDSDAIIGLPSQGTVLKYDLGSEEVTPMPSEKQTLRNTSIQYKENEDGSSSSGGGGKMVMEFTKFLIEENEVPILEEGQNIFLHARSQSSELGFHDTYLSFRKDFAEDEVVESSALGSVEPPTTGSPTNLPTTSPPTTSPTSSPTGRVERFFCIDEDASLKENKHCNESRFPDFYDSFDDCDNKCKGKWNVCQSVFCVTERPTLSPTVSMMPSSSSPTGVPTASPTTGLPTMTPTIAPTKAPSPSPMANLSPEGIMSDSLATTAATPSSNPTQPKFTFAIPENKVDPTRSIPISPFQLDLVVVVVPPSSSNNENDAGREQRRQLQLKLLQQGEEEEEGGQAVVVVEDVFQLTQSFEIRSLVSSHLQKRFAKNLEGEPISVELGEVEEKSEEVIDEEGNEVLVTYNFMGFAIYAVGVDDESPSGSSLPTTADLDDQVLRAFNTGRGQRAFMQALGYMEDELLMGIVSVSALNENSIDANELDPSKVVEGGSDLVSDTASDDGEGGGKEGVALLVAIIATAFAITFLVIGLLTVRKYRRYQLNNANNNNDCHPNYQNRRRRLKLTIDPYSKKKLNHYAHFESPEGSLVSCPSDEEKMYDMDIVGGDTYPASQEHSDADPSSPGKQFNPNDETLPYDEEEAATSAAAYDMTYFAHSARQMVDESSADDHHTLEGLYSDKDSYFQTSPTGKRCRGDSISTIDPSVVGGVGFGGTQHHQNESFHSLDTLDNTFGFATNESIARLLLDEMQGVVENEVRNVDALQADDQGTLDQHRDTSSSQLAEGQDDLNNPSVPLSPVEQRGGHIGEIVLEDTSKELSNGEENDQTLVFEDRPEEIIPKCLSWKFDDDLTEATAVSNPHGNEELVKYDDKDAKQDAAVDVESSINTSVMSTTDELFARIAELESKILHTENQLAMDDDIKELVAPSNEDIEPPSPPPPTTSASPTKIDELDIVSVKAPAATDTSIQKGLFTEDTLVMIEQSRLHGTPPPSEGEIDNEMIREARENTLLGKYLGDDTDSEEDSVFV